MMMNENNIRGLKEELIALGFSQEIGDRMHESIALGISSFTLREQLQGLNGPVDLDLHFRQSNKSEYYYFNKFEATQSKGWSLNEGEQYFVIAPLAEGNLGLKLQTPRVAEALQEFKRHEQTAQLGFGQSLEKAQLIVERVNGKLSEIPAEFIATYRNPPVSQTMWVDRGKGFTAQHAVNLIEGRSVYRDDLMSQAGTPYKAWVKLDLDGERDKYQNYSMNTYNDPSYGFDLRASLGSYQINGMENKTISDGIMEALRNGDRALVSIEKGGKLEPVYLEAAPRFLQLNLYNKEGRSLKREDYQKQLAPQVAKEKSKHQKQSVNRQMGI
ncbi:hypothetical protein ACTJKC_02705 [Pedobacter sp. 22226]|uniref:hypothetical protein n=1 Tax=Pedobacter sp. 22226 TaxID=3453894 RepID=UPI003F860C9A